MRGVALFYLGTEAPTACELHRLGCAAGVVLACMVLTSDPCGKPPCDVQVLQGYPACERCGGPHFCSKGTHWGQLGSAHKSGSTCTAGRRVMARA